MSIQRTDPETGLRTCIAGTRAVRIGLAHTTSRKGSEIGRILSWSPRNRLDAILLERFSCRNGKAHDWEPDEMGCSGMTDSSHRITTAGRRETGVIAIATCWSAGGPSASGSSIPRRFSGERNGIGNLESFRSKTRTKRTNSNQA